MFSEVKTIYMKHKNLILFLAFAYGATIVFPAFGPALKVAHEGDISIISTTAFFFYVIAFSFPAKTFSSPRIKIRNLLFYLAILSPFILFFDIISVNFKWITIIMLSLVAGQLGSLWTQLLRSNVENNERGRVVALSIALTFFILYISTIIIKYSSVRVALIIPVVLMFMSILKLSNIYKNYELSISKFYTYEKNFVNHITNKTAYILYAIFIIIYVSGGFTYAGIFPKFESYTFVSKYYNVQPLFLTVILAGIIADKFARKTILYIGFGMVGLSFITFMLPVSFASYLLTQTFIQVGWGFVNTFVWVVSADISITLEKPTIAARGVACMLFGTVIGAFFADYFGQLDISQDVLYAAVTLAPLFVGLILINFVVETLSPASIDTIQEFHESDTIDIDTHEAFSNLTSREKEVVLLLLENHSRSEICSILNISINTLKTHIRHIYKKLGVTGKESLRKLIG